MSWKNFLSNRGLVSTVTTGKIQNALEKFDNVPAKQVKPEQVITKVTEKADWTLLRSSQWNTVLKTSRITVMSRSVF